MVKMTNKKLKVGNVPNLRFPGFKGEWEMKKLGEIADKITDGTHDTPKPVEEGIPFLTAIHIKDGFVDYKNCYYLEQEVHNIIYKRCNPEKNDLLIVNIGAGTATCALNIVDYEFSLKNVALVKPNKNIIDGIYLAQLQRKNSAKIFNQLTSGGAQPFLSLKEIGRLLIKFPSLSEQQKIASFLSLVDERIATQNKIIEQLETLIKGLSEKLFSQKVRFKEFTDGWELRSLGEIGETFNGLSGKNKDNFGKGKPYIQYKQIFDSSRVQLENCGLVEISKNENQNSVRYGDIFFTISSETSNDIGMSSVLLDKVSEVYLNSFCFGYRVLSFQILHPLFSSYLFRSSIFRTKIVKLAQGSTRYNMSKVELMKLTISLPCEEEQTSISQFLFSIDSKIQTEKNTLEKYHSQKEYLLQNLFI